MNAPPVLTVGHSDRSLEEFVGLLSEANVERLVDIRTIPRSRANPQFNVEHLPASLLSFGISYEHNAALGARRKKASDVAHEVNGFWVNQSFHNYADYALSEHFRAGFAQLLDGAGKRRCAIMCAEAVWWSCHRRIVADYLIAAGMPVLHIMARNRLELARMTPGAVIRPDGTIVYPAMTGARV